MTISNHRHQQHSSEGRRPSLSGLYSLLCTLSRRDSYMITSMDGQFVYVQKLCGNQFRSKKYPVKLTEIYPIQKHVNRAPRSEIESAADTSYSSSEAFESDAMDNSTSSESPDTDSDSAKLPVDGLLLQAILPPAVPLPVAMIEDQIEDQPPDPQQPVNDRPIRQRKPPNYLVKHYVTDLEDED